VAESKAFVARQQRLIVESERDGQDTAETETIRFGQVAAAPAGVLPSLAGSSFRAYGICLDYRLSPSLLHCRAHRRSISPFRSSVTEPSLSIGVTVSLAAARPWMRHDGVRRLLDPGMKTHRTDNVPREQRGQDKPQTKNPHRHHARNHSRARSESEYPEVSALRLRFSWEFDGWSRVRLSAERCFHATRRVSRTLSNILSS
jgi:hypothetical protein